MPRKKVVTEVIEEARHEGTRDPKAVQTARERCAKVQQKAQGLTVEGVVKETAALGVKVNQVLNTLSQQLVSRLEDLKTAQEAIQLAEQDLQALSDKETVAMATNELVFQHEQRMASLQAELDAKEAQAKEFEGELVKRRQREQVEYDYRTSQERRRQEDLFKDSLAAQRKETASALEQLQKDWKNREEELAAKEAHVKGLQEQVDSFPARLEADTAKVVAQATKSLHAEYGVKATLAAKDAEADKRQAAQEVQGLRATIANLEQTVQALREELTDKSRQVQEVAIAAVNSAAGRQALEAVQQSVASQASGGTGKK